MGSPTGNSTCSISGPIRAFYKLRLECVGKSAKSEGYNLGVASVRLRERRPRVEKYGHDKEQRLAK